MSAILEGLEFARRPDRLYPILSSPWYDFYAGHTSEGMQLVAGEWCPDLLIGLFDNEGDLREVSCETIHEQHKVEQYLHDKFSYTPGLVRVKRFRIALSASRPVDPLQLALIGESGFAVAPFPLTWEECYGDPSDFPEEPDFVETVRGWIAGGNFVLLRGNEIQLNGNGEVIGS